MSAWDQVREWYLRNGYTAAADHIGEARRDVWALNPEGLLRILKASETLLRPGPVKSPSADTVRRDRQYAELIHSEFQNRRAA